MKLEEAEKSLAAALGRVPSGIFVVTGKSGGRATGMLCSWLQQCSFRPPRLSLAIAPQREMSAWFLPGQTFTVNILEAGQTDLVIRFGKGIAPHEDAFRDLEVLREGPGGPVLAEALAVLECRVVSRHPAGDHDLIVADIDSGRILDDTGQPMVHIRKNGLHY